MGGVVLSCLELYGSMGFGGGVVRWIRRRVQAARTPVAHYIHVCTAVLGGMGWGLGVGGGIWVWWGGSELARILLNMACYYLDR